MSIIKKTNLLLLILITLQVFGNTIPEQNTNFFISGNYEEQGVKINYSAIVNAVLSSDFNEKKQLALQLSSFLIEDVKYNNRTYRDNDVFGISFPIDTAVEITSNIQLLYGVKLINETIILHPNKKTILDLNKGVVDFNEIKFKVSNTVSIKALFKHETFIATIKKAIENNTKRKDSEVIEAEHTRLMILGNSYLNENNYSQAVSTYLHAKKFATDISYADSQIITTAKYAKKDNIIIDTNRKLQATVSKSYYTNKQPTIVSKPTTSKNTQYAVTTRETVSKSSKVEYSKDDDGNEFEYEYTPKKTNEPVYAVNSNNPEEYGYEYEYEEENNIKEASTIFDDQESEYEYDEVKNSSSTKSESDVEYDDVNGNSLSTQNSYAANEKPAKVSSYSAVKKIATQQSNIKKIVSNEPKNKVSEEVKKPSDKNYEVIRTKKGYIKYKKDQQAVEDREGNILIPYGKYEIIRFRAGFARVKIKDAVEIKNIVCTNKNEEYNWSARIYENPWQETVIDKNGSSVDKTIKKVEIYIVDNVANIPNNELSPELLKRYEDPNPFKGTQQISAFNLWNRNNGNKPSVIEARAKIERLKKVSKDKAFEGAEACRKQVSKRFEEVFDYYQEMGYDIILKD